MGSPAARSTADNLRRIPPQIHIKAICSWREIIRKNTESCKAIPVGSTATSWKGGPAARQCSTASPSTVNHPALPFVGLSEHRLWRFFYFFFLRLTPLPSLYARTTNLTRFKTNDEIKCCISPHRTEVTCCKMHLCHKMHPCAAVGTALAQPQSGCPLHSPSESSVEPGISNRYQWFLFLLMCSGFSLVWLFFIALTEVKILARCQR